MSSNRTEQSIGVVSLDCPKALIDSEYLLTRLLNDGYALSELEDASLCIVNTGGLYNEELQNLLVQSDDMPILVTGCLPENEDIINQQFSHVKLVDSTHYSVLLAAVCEQIPRPANTQIVDLPTYGVKLTPPHYAYLNLSNGNKSIADVFGEANALVQDGAQELILYGVQENIRDYCEKLATLNVWIRIQQIHSVAVLDTLAPLMASGGVLPYANLFSTLAAHDMSCFQKQLQQMNQWKNQLPELALRAEMSVPLVIEKLSDKDFSLWLDFIEQAQFERVDFLFGNCANAEAWGESARSICQDRLQILRTTQHNLTQAMLNEKIGAILPVMVDDTIDGIENVALGRTVHDAPAIDGIVQIEAIYGATPGQIVHVEIVDATEGDLIAIPA